jgi:hypothetical protein
MVDLTRKGPRLGRIFKSESSLTLAMQSRALGSKSRILRGVPLLGQLWRQSCRSAQQQPLHTPGRPIGKLTVLLANRSWQQFTWVQLLNPYEQAKFYISFVEHILSDRINKSMMHRSRALGRFAYTSSR